MKLLSSKEAGANVLPKRAPFSAQGRKDFSIYIYIHEKCHYVLELLNLAALASVLGKKLAAASTGCANSSSSSAESATPVGREFIEIRGVKNAAAFGVNGNNTPLITERRKRDAVKRETAGQVVQPNIRGAGRRE